MAQSVGVKRTCYACEAEGQTREHVPAESYFPGEKEQLVTVPSCKKHNEDLNNDQAYLRMVLSMSSGRNAIGAEIAETAFRGLRKNHPKWLRRMQATLKPLTMHHKGLLVPSGAVGVDTACVARVLEGYGRGLYYHEHKYARKAPVKCAVVPFFLAHSDIHMWILYRSLRSVLPYMFHGCPTQGGNPEVFWWRTLAHPHGVEFWMCFYGDLHVLVGFDETADVTG